MIEQHTTTNSVQPFFSLSTACCKFASTRTTWAIMTITWIMMNHFIDLCSSQIKPLGNETLSLWDQIKTSCAPSFSTQVPIISRWDAPILNSVQHLLTLTVTSDTYRTSQSSLNESITAWSEGVKKRGSEKTPCLCLIQRVSSPDQDLGVLQESVHIIILLLLLFSHTHTHMHAHCEYCEKLENKSHLWSCFFSS